MGLFKSLISLIVPPQPYEVAPQVVCSIINILTNTSVSRKFDEFQRIRNHYPDAIRCAYGCDDLYSFDRFQQVIQAAILAFLWWHYGEFPNNEVLQAARGGIITAANWGNANPNFTLSWGRTNDYFNECKNFIETEIYHIPKEDEYSIKYIWEVFKDTPDLTDRYFSCALNWMARKLFINDVKSFRPLSDRMPFYHPIRELLYEACQYCDRRIESDVSANHF